MTANAPGGWLTIAEAAARLRSGEMTSRQLTEAALERIRATDERVRAFRQ